MAMRLLLVKRFEASTSIFRSGFQAASSRKDTLIFLSLAKFELGQAGGRNDAMIRLDY